MNNLFSKYSKKFMGLAMASLVFTACEQDEFTEQNALDLELQRLQEQERIAEEMDIMNHKQEQDLAMYQRTLDSLDRLNAGGLVYYSVIPVSAAEAVFAAGGSNGRTEEIQGVDVATVTISQYGRVITANGEFDVDENGQNYGEQDLTGGATAANGVYTFPMLRSGEIGVTIEAEDHTTVNYVANLTPDGAVANGQITYVSNVIPLFNIGEADKMATIEGKAWAETDLTNGVEEPVPDGTSITGTIDVADSDFWDRYFKENNDEGQGYNSGNATYVSKSGWIQRYAYELPSDSGAGIMRTTVTSGDYRLLVPSTSVGLPIHLKFSEFASDRAFYRDNDIVQTRHVYGPEVIADDFDNGVDMPEFRFQAYETAATGTAQYTAPVFSGKWDITGNPGWYMDVKSAGLPTITTSGQADGTLSVGNPITDDTGSDFDKGLDLNPTNSINAEDPKEIESANEPTVVATRQDIFEIGSAFVRGSAEGTLSNYVQILNSGFGFVTASTDKVISNPNTFTGYAPQVLFPIPDSGEDADRATGAVVLNDIGIVTEIVVSDQGRNYFTPTSLDVSLEMGQSGSTTLGTGNEPLVVRGDGTVLFYEGGIAKSVIYNVGAGSKYSYLPNVGLGTASTNTAELNALNSFIEDLSFLPRVGGDPNLTSFGFITVLSTSGDVNFTSANAQGQNDILGNPIVPFDKGGPGDDDDLYYFTSAMSAVGPNVSSEAFELSINAQPVADPSGFSAVANIPENEGSGVDQYTSTLTAKATIAERLDLVGLKELETGFTSAGLQPLYGNLPGTAGMAGFYVSNRSGDSGSNANLASDVLDNARFLVVVTGAIENNFAWGLPSLDDDGQVRGIRWVYRGGYQTLTAAPGYPIYIVPNIFRDDEGRESDIEKIGQELKKLVDEDTFTFEATKINNPAKSTVTITNAGAGYATQPSAILWADNANYVGLGVNAFSNAISSKLELSITDGSISFNDGELTETFFASDINGGLPSDLREDVTYNVTFIDKLSESIDMAFNSVTGQSTGMPSGVLSVNNDGGLELDMMMHVPSNGTMVEAWTLLPGLPYNNPPNVTISSVIGTNATARAITTGDDGTPLKDLFDDTNTAWSFTVEMIDAGTDYARGNSYYNWGDGDNHQIGNQGQNFRLIGGNSSDKEDNMNFDAFTGMIYVRDVHYGTGREVE